MEGGFAAQTDGVDAIADRARRGPVRAAGGLVARDGLASEHASRTDEHILLVHRPRFDDWSLPKGKLKRGEHPLAAAVREVHEETTVSGVPGIRLPSVSYQVWSGQSLVDKVVDWWAMTVAVDDSAAHGSDRPGSFTPTDEVDDLAWMPVARALEVLTYDRDRRVVSAYADLPPLSRPVVVLRHARAVDRRDWPGPDAERPLDRRGEAQAAALTDLLHLLRPGRLVGAEPLRCRQTLAGLSRTLGINLEIEERLSEGADSSAAAAALRRLASNATATVVCGQGAPILAAIAALLDEAGSRTASVGVNDVLAPGDGFVLSFSGATLVAADPFSPGVS